MPRALRPLMVLLSSGGFLLLIQLTVGPHALGRPRPTELQLAAPVACPTCPGGQALRADAGSPIVAPKVVEVHDLASLKPADAARLDGKRALFRVVIDGPADRQGDRDVYEVLPSGDPQGVLFLPAGPDVEGVLTVEARLVMIRHPVRVIGATPTAAFMEFRLLDTQAVGGRRSSIVKDIVPGPGVTPGAAPTSQRIRCYTFSSQPHCAILSSAASRPFRIGSLS